MTNDVESGNKTSSSAPAAGNSAATTTNNTPPASSSPNNVTNDLIKFAALIILTVQNAALVLIMRASQLGWGKSGDAAGVTYLASTAVFMGELVKLVSSYLLLSYEMKSFGAAARELKAYVLDSPRDFAMVSVPAFLYVVQNNVAFIATANLDPAPYQLLYQLKIFTTAVLSILMLRKILTGAHWRGLAVLFVGVCLVQFSTLKTTGGGEEGDSFVVGEGGKATKMKDQNPFIGLVAILVAVMCSGLSGVWFEKILKTKPGSIWVRNFQLALLSLAIGGFQIFTADGAAVAENGFFGGYDWVVWSVVLVQSAGGLIVAVVVKYADNILKGFATSLATVLSTVCSVIWFDFKVTPIFSVGAVFVLGSAFLYNAAEDAQKRANVSSSSAAAAAGNGAGTNGTTSSAASSLQMSSLPLSSGTGLHDAETTNSSASEEVDRLLPPAAAASAGSKKKKKLNALPVGTSS